MFSVDNFYAYFNNLYGFERTGVMTWKPISDGSKSIADFMPFGIAQTVFAETDVSYKINGCFILHDQEPFDWNFAIDTYRHHLCDIKKIKIAESLTDAEIMHYRWRTMAAPIVCHSDFKSADTTKLEDNGFIPVYYFWHALVSRDWFRHWRYYQHLDPAPNYLKSRRFLMYIREANGTRAYRKKLKEDLAFAKNHIVCNWNDAEQISSDASADLVLKDAEQTYIQIVAETLFETDKIHATEKCFKPMVMRQPFLLFAPPGTLSYLKSYGFKTFSDAWDESYDDEKDHDQRYSMLIKIVSQLLNLSSEDFRQIMAKCQTTVLHNVKHFFSEEFGQHLIDEFHCNIRKGLITQASKIRDDPGGQFFHLIDTLRNRGLDLPWYLRDAKDTYLAQLKSRYPARHADVLKQYAW